jgi:putative transposase
MLELALAPGRGVVRINGETHLLWRAVDYEGEVLEVFATKRRDGRAALEFLKRPLKRYGRPGTIVTDRLRSYRAAIKAIGIAGRRECGRWLNNLAENSHQPFRRRETANGQIQGHRDPAEIRRRSSLAPQSLPPGPSL